MLITECSPIILTSFKLILQVLTERVSSFTTGIHLGFKHIQVGLNFGNKVALLYALQKDSEAGYLVR